MAKPKTFEDAVEEVERIVKQIENDEIGLEQSLAAYDRGTVLIKHCREILNKAEQTIEQLSADAEGNPQTEPMP